MKYLTLPKKKRLTDNRQFKAVLDHGRRARGRWITLYAAPNECGYRRLGVSVGRAAGNAVVRNHLKRLLREAFRRHQDRIPPGFDYVLIVTPAAARRLRSRHRRVSVLAEWTGPRIQQSFLSLIGAVFADRQWRAD